MDNDFHIRAIKFGDFDQLLTEYYNIILMDQKVGAITFPNPHYEWPCIYTYLLCYRWEFIMNFGFTMTLLGKGWVEVEAYLSDAVIFMGGVLFGRYDEAIHGWGTSPPHPLIGWGW